MGYYLRKYVDIFLDSFASAVRTTIGFLLWLTRPLATWLAEHPRALQVVEGVIAFYWTMALIHSLVRRDIFGVAFNGWFLYQFVKRGGGWWKWFWDDEPEPQPDPDPSISL